MCFCADCVLALRVEDYQVSVSSDRDRPFPRIKAKQLRRSCGHEFHETVRAESSSGHAAGIDQAHAMLHAGTAIRDLRKIIESHFLLLLETKGAVVGRDHLQMVTLQTIPQFFLMPLLAQRRRENIFRAFKSG